MASRLTALPRAEVDGRGQPSGRAMGLLQVTVWLAVHLFVGIGGALSGTVATAHFLLASAVCGFLIVASPRVERVLAATVYCGVCDVFWRASGSRAPWEVSKYMVAVGAVVLLVRFVHRYPEGRAPFVVLLLLVPGLVATLMAEGILAGREMISSAEMGLLSFGLAALAFRHLVASRVDAWNLGWVVMGPLVAVLGVTSHALLTNPDLEFTSQSNFESTGGFGPNQVSAALGLVMLLCVVLSFLPGARRLWPVLVGIGLWSLWAAFLTFSRGGIYSLVIAGGAMLMVGVSTRGARARSVAMLVLGAIALALAFSSANDFSGNWLDTRYNEAGNAGRTTIATLDMEVFGSHPIAGVGSGRAAEYRRADRLADASAHTEYTRVAAEHGILGLAALAGLAVILVQGYRRSLSHWNRLMVVALAAWGLTTMLHSATRIGAVPVMLALTQLRVEDTS